MSPADLLTQSSPVVKVGGRDLGDVWLAALVSLRVQRGLGTVGRAVLRFNDPGYVLSTTASFKAGDPVSIAVSGGGELLSGIVTGASLEQSSRDHPELVVTVDEPGVRCTLGATASTYLTRSYAEILRTIAGRNGLSLDLKLDTAKHGMGTVHDYLLQNGSDLALIDEIVRRSAAVWWMDGKNLRVRAPHDSLGEATARLGEDLTDFSVRTSGLRPSSVVVNGLDTLSQSDITATSKTVPANVDSQFARRFQNGPQVIQAGAQQTRAVNPEDTQQAVVLADSLNSQWQSGAVVARGTGTVNAKITPMAKLTVESAGPASGTYRVSEVEHIYRGDGFHTRFTAGPTRPAGLIDTLGPSAPDPGFTISQLLTAEVTQIKDDKKLGRVKVKFHGTDGKIESAWARVVSLGGGKSRGSVFLPEVGDEVLVGFERGDSRHPVVLGGLYSSKATLAADTSKLVDAGSKVGYRRITSRLGHVVELGDGTSPTDQHILLALADGKNLVRVGADKLDVTTDKKAISISTGMAKIEIDPAGNITIEGNRISLKAKADVAVEGATVAVKGQGAASLEGAVVSVKGTGNVGVTASGPLALKGAVVAIN